MPDAALHPPHRRQPERRRPERRALAIRWHWLLRRLARSELRNSDLVLLGLSALVGCGAALAVALLNVGMARFHALSFGVSLDQRSSASVALDWWRVLLAPTAGGLVVGAAALLIRRFSQREIVDAIEANALHGGRMSMRDSLNLALLTLLSGGAGASVGMEAAYTQLGAAIGSKLGRFVNLRRDDVRTLVGCGAAGAIAAAFNAPLAGAFYAFELIVGSYTLAVLGPIAVAALAGAFTVRWIVGAEPMFSVAQPVTLSPPDYVAFFALGLAAAGLSVIVMRGVTGAEQWFQRRSFPLWLRPGFGGLVVGMIAISFPQVLGGGHSAIVTNLDPSFAPPLLLGLIAAKAIASAISIGSGFRGGLFSSSLFLGSVFGAAIATVALRIDPGLGIDPLAYTLVGMGAVAAGIVGAPVTMIMLVLETSSDFSATTGVMVGVITSSVAVRHWFGYSFATWRFHLRGLRIQSPEDIGWIDELTVASAMRRDPPIIAADASIAALRQAFPLGSVKHVFAVDRAGGFVGLVDVAAAYGADRPPDSAIDGVVAREANFLLGRQNIRTAIERFRQAAVETLPVVDDPERRRVLGYLTEDYAMRRYTQELERRRSVTLGGVGIFSPGEGASAAGQQ